jgi:hypothetical protein
MMSAGRIRSLASAIPMVLGAGLTGCGSDGPVGPPPPPLPAPEPPPGPPRHMRLDLRWQAVEVRFDEEPAHLDARVFVSQPSVRVFLPADTGRPRPGGMGPDGPITDERVFRVGEVPEQLANLMALDLQRFAVRTGELYLVDLNRGSRPMLWLHRLELAIENVATRARLMEGLPTLLSARGRIDRSGRLTLFVSADPFGTGLDFSGRASVVGLDLRELAGLLVTPTGLRITRGSLDLFIVFTSERGRIRGAVKPIVRGLELEPARTGLWGWIRANTIDALADLVAPERDSREVLATVIPIEGQLHDPEIQVWPAVFGVLYNALVAGISASFAGLPPERAAARSSPLEQGWRVLIGGERPRAQPSSGPVPPRLHPEPDWLDIPIAVSPAGLLKVGAERVLQRALHRRGVLSPAQLSGRIDSATTEALRRVQAAAALPETGLLGYATVEALGLDPAELFERAPRVRVGAASSASPGPFGR